MRLDPIYLLAPEPDDEPKTYSRRSVVSFAALALGLGFGAGAGLARLLRAPAVPSTVDDPELAWAIGLCEGPIEGLVTQRSALLGIVVGRPEIAIQLAPGIERLIDYASGSTDDAERREIATELLAVVESTRDALPVSTTNRIPELHSLAR